MPSTRMVPLNTTPVEYGTETIEMGRAMKSPLQRNISKNMTGNVSAIPNGRYKEFLWCSSPAWFRGRDNYTFDSKGRLEFVTEFNTLRGDHTCLVDETPSNVNWSMGFALVAVDIWEEHAENLNNWKEKVNSLKLSQWSLKMGYGLGGINNWTVFVSALMKKYAESEELRNEIGDIQSFLRFLQSHAGTPHPDHHWPSNYRKVTEDILIELYPDCFGRPPSQASEHSSFFHTLKSMGKITGLTVPVLESIDRYLHTYPKQIVDRIVETAKAGHVPIMPQWAGWHKDVWNGPLTDPCTGVLTKSPDGNFYSLAESKILSGTAASFCTHIPSGASTLKFQPSQQWYDLYHTAVDRLLTFDSEMDSNPRNEIDLSLMCARMVPIVAIEPYNKFKMIRINKLTKQEVSYDEIIYVIGTELMETDDG